MIKSAFAGAAVKRSVHRLKVAVERPAKKCRLVVIKMAEGGNGMNLEEIACSLKA
jgi:hypothetical protein